MNNIREMRVRANLKQVDVADKIGVSQSNVANWEAGRNMPTADKLPELARLFNCKIDDLFDKED